MSKPEVCEYLGKSKRTIETLVARGRLKIGYYKGPNGRTGVFDRADVEALKHEIGTAPQRDITYRATPVPESQRDIRQGFLHIRREKPAEVSPDAIAQLAAAIRTAQPPALPPTLTPHMSLSEAVEYSGLPAAFLVAEARAGRIRAVNVGTKEKEFWRFAKEAV